MKAIANITILMVFLVCSGMAFASSGIDVRNTKTASSTAPGGTAFIEAPAKGLAGIYKDFHDWKVDKGIAEATAALKAVDEMYKRDQDAVLADTSLRLNRVFEVKSTLHTMLGMLYYRKSLLIIRDSTSDAQKALMEKIEKGQAISDADLARVASEAEGRSSSRGRQDTLMSMAVNEFKAASDIDPANPSPHYQLAGIYSAMPVSLSGDLAELEYFRGAELSLKEGQREPAMSALQAIKRINATSAYVAKIEEMLAR